MSPNRALSIAVHVALGIGIGVVGLGLMPEALRVDDPWLPIAAFVVGGAFFIVADRAIRVIECRLGGGDAGPWLVFFAVSVDLFTDGMMIGTRAVVGSTLALLLAVGQVAVDLPEGFATAAG